MLKLNMLHQTDAALNKFGSRIYATPEKQADGTQWVSFSDPDAIRTMIKAFAIVTGPTVCCPAGDKYFKKLPGKRSLTDMVQGPDENFWISYDPTGPAVGATVGDHVTIGRGAVSFGHWTVAATLVHELAHANGAALPGQAEKALMFCGLREHYRETND